MSYKSLYRVYRPDTFDDVYGQQQITDILKNQVAGGKPSHAYLFCGPRGTGKTSTAKIFANALNCLNLQNGNPCHECEVCKGFEKDAFVDIVEIDAASNNGVDNVRDIREKVSLLPAQGKYKVYIIDEVHMLSPGAFNALLKTLEEPPPHAVFILATTEIRKVPATILSRCQRYDFKRITERDIMARLAFVADKQGIEYEEDALKLIAQQAEGAMRDALSIMDQCIAAQDRLTKETVFETVGIADSQEITELAQAILGENAGQALALVDSMLQGGVSAHNILRDTIVALSEELAKTVRDPYKCANTLRSLEALIGVQTTLRYAGVPNAVLIAAVVRAASNTTDVDTEDMELRLKKLEQRVEKLAS
ncbi:DNA polymerase III subunit gamma/tau, partial [Christensenellaceae bacterium OttesenSCG-928-K19]|nr:DNA polymerase III subunit gamma/tau [Christensenellaceae bacterium OttesenSCG-928-K19]